MNEAHDGRHTRLAVCAIDIHGLQMRHWLSTHYAFADDTVRHDVQQVTLYERKVPLCTS